jgi:hypothetical protein
MFAESDRRGRRNNVFLIGAGASVSAGIPGAADIGRLLVKEIARRLGLSGYQSWSSCEAYWELEKRARFNNCRKVEIDKAAAPEDGMIDWWRVYDHAFQRYFSQPDDVRRLFSEIVEKAQGAINWSHLVIGEIVAAGIASTIVTTNFDQLVLSGMVRAGVIPVVCDGLESLNRIDGSPTHPQLIEIHGSRHTYLLRNAPDDVASLQQDPGAIAAVQSLFHHAHAVVVVGYGGRETGLMDLLIKAGQAYPDKHLYWILYDDNLTNLAPKARAFLQTSKNGGVLLGQDSDCFFLELSKALGIGSPSTIGNPLRLARDWLYDLNRSSISNDDIRAELDRAVRRLERLESSGALAEPDPTLALIDEIRAKRLSGDHLRAYELAEQALTL